MAEVIYTTPNMARNTQGEREERIVEIYATSESLRDKHQDYVGTEESSNTLGTVRSQQPDPVSPPQWPIRAVVVLLVLLSVALLAGLLGLAVQHKNVIERDMEQLFQMLKNVTEQQKSISEKTISMDRKMEQLHKRLKNVTEQRDSLLCKQDCPGGWDKFGCKCYQVTSEWGSWSKCRELCVSKGADLVVVDSKEMDFISRYTTEYFWIGATDEASEGMWRWVDGTVLSAASPSWSGGKPDGEWTSTKTARQPDDHSTPSQQQQLDHTLHGGDVRSVLLPTSFSHTGTWT
ncbi:C-type lectin domain family 12 member B-like [Gadus chalcogrammus]|uniref:C-type lectin domain family 12 member B-like n=1 Tax=Gadus chalcogrammus TaxID=1042646 RepID=UPI0024C49958|nr:C-type lectin domain family 12 member B-like [Gadus chalcogrammus]